MKVSEVIAKAKQNQGVTSEEALGRLLGVSGVTIMRWRRGMAVPEPVNAQHLADLAGIDAAAFVAEMLIQSTDDTALKASLVRLRQAVAALLTLAATSPALTGLAASVDCILC
jgi:transcriptional regulator with XRE-family HTH domain